MLFTEHIDTGALAAPEQSLYTTVTNPHSRFVLAELDRTRTVEDMKENALLSGDDVARQFRVSPRTIRRLRAEGRLPFVRVGPKLIRFDPRAVEEFLRTNTEGPT